jgi:glycosyltransferase involved in cell wall biosynthesis
MPTQNRRGFIPAAIDCFLKQTYENRELVILNDGDPIGDIVPLDPRIHYFTCEKVSTGEKRNQINRLACGEIICHMDSDDWSAPERIADQVKRLQDSGNPITGYSDMLFWDVLGHQAKCFRSSIAGYVCGMSFCYRRSFWEKNPFPNLQKGSDNEVVYANLKSIAASRKIGMIVARIHGQGHAGGTHSNITEIVAREGLGDFWL